LLVPERQHGQITVREAPGYAQSAARELDDFLMAQQLAERFTVLAQHFELLIYAKLPGAQRSLINLRALRPDGEALPKPFQFQNDIKAQLRAAAKIKQFIVRTQGIAQIGRVRNFLLHLCEDALQAQQKACAFMEWVFINGHAVPHSRATAATRNHCAAKPRNGGGAHHF
jgi:hypothetical protein